MKVHRDIGVRVAALLKGQLDVQAHGFPAAFGRALVGRFHDAGTTTGDDGVVIFRQPL